MKHLKYLLMAALVAMPLTACDEDPVVTTTGSVEGTVSAGGAALAGVSVTLVGPTSGAVTTGSDGRFAFNDVEAGSYGVTISNFPADVTFAEPSKTTAITSQGQTATVDFSGSYISTSAVTGFVTASGSPVDVTVTLSGGPQNVSNSTGTSAGMFSFTGLRAGTYTVTISGIPSGVRFANLTNTVTVGPGEQRAVNFPGEAIQVATINGSVTVDNLGIAGVTVNLTGVATAATTETGSGGAFVFSDLTPGSYTVTIVAPANTGFPQLSRTVTVNEGQTAVLNFAGVLNLATIYGTVTVDDIGKAGVTMAVSGPVIRTTETGTAGAYSFPNLPIGTYTVSVTPPAGTSFDPLSKTVTLTAGAAEPVNFAGKGPDVPATISIQSITQGGTTTPVDLTNVSGQIEVALNITEGSRALRLVEVWIGDKVVAAQTFTPQPVVEEAELVTTQTIILNVPTNQVRMGTTAYVPVVFNGQNIIAAKLYEVGDDPPIPSNNVPVVMNNPDVLLVGDVVIEAITLEPNVTVGGNTWYKSDVRFSGPQYVAFSTIKPTSVNWPSAGVACPVSGTIAGEVTTGLVITNTYNCNNFEGYVVPNSAAAPTFAPAVPPAGPQGSTVTYPTNGFRNLGAEFELQDEDRWFLITTPFFVPTAALTGVYADKKAPTVEVFGQTSSTLIVGLDPVSSLLVAYNRFFDEPWVNAEYEFIDAVVTTDGGSGVDVATRTTWEWPGTVTTTWPLGTCTGATEIIVTGDDLDETIASDGTPDGYKLCASAADLLGNVGLSRASNWFGVDKVAPLVRVHGTTTATPALTGTVATGTAAGQVSATPNTTIYNILDPYPATHVWGLEAIDGRSGFHQGAPLPAPYTDMYPASQTIIRTTVLGPDTVMGPNLLNLVLTDNYVRTDAEWAFLGGLVDPGYYWYQGKVTDRAGNVGTMFTRNWLVDEIAAPTIAFLSYAQTFYAPGTDATFVIFGQDDLEVIDATVTMDYPTVLGVLGIQHSQAVGARWDGLDPFDAGAFTTAVTGVTFTVPSVLGRYDFVCLGAGVPYPGCITVNAPTPVVAEFNTAPTLLGGFGDARNLLPVSATPTEFVDAGGNPSIAGASVPFNVLQWSDTTRAPWLDDLDNDGIQDLLTWRIFSPTTTTFAAEHMAPTSIKDTFFAAVALVRNDGGTIITCGLFPAPALTDTGINRFWTYTLAKPTASSTGSMKACFDAAGTYHAAGVLDNAAFITDGILP